jgi:hypothetical protein
MAPTQRVSLRKGRSSSGILPEWATCLKSSTSLLPHLLPQICPPLEMLALVAVGAAAYNVPACTPGRARAAVARTSTPVMDETILEKALAGELEEEGAENVFMSEVGWAYYLDKEADCSYNMNERFSQASDGYVTPSILSNPLDGETCTPAAAAATSPPSLLHFAAPAIHTSQPLCLGDGYSLHSVHPVILNRCRPSPPPLQCWWHTRMHC